MIKRMIAIFLSALCFAFPASANIRIDAEVVNNVIKEFFTNESSAKSALTTYINKLNSDGSISATAIWDVCYAGGLNIRKADDKATCVKFKNTLLKSIKFFEVCGKEATKSGANEKCVKDFKGIQVTMSPAIMLAQEYGLVKDGDASLVCSSSRRKKGLQDFVKCVSVDKDVYYEFEFDDVKESKDTVIQSDIQSAVCMIHNSTATKGGFVGGGTNVSSMSTYIEPSCSGDETLCKKINRSMQKFGYSAQWNNSQCKIRFDAKSRSDLRTAYGINNFEFCHGIQIQNAPDAEAAIKRFIIEQARKQGEILVEDDIKCNAGFNTYTDTGCAVNKISNFKDDVKTCFAKGNQIDFVFDDVNEAWKTYHKGGIQAMNCIANNGIFDGKNCTALGEMQCEELKKANITDCPECKSITWDAKNQLCVLPDSKNATNLQKGINYGTLALTVVAGTAITVGSGGTASGVWVVVAKVGATTMVVGAGTKLLAEGIMTWGKFEPFIKQANQCILSGESGCAEDLVVNKLQQYMSYKKNFTAAETNALDEIFSKLVEQIPNDSAFWQDFANNPDLWDCTEDGLTCRIKTKAQFWQIASTAGDVMMIAGGLMQAIGLVGAQNVSRTQETIYRTCEEKLMVKNGFRSGDLRVVSVNGAAAKGGNIVENSRIVEMGLVSEGTKSPNLTAARQLVADGTATLNKPFTYSWQQAIGTSTREVVTNTLVPTLNGVALAGTALTQAHQLKPGENQDSFYITRPDGTVVPVVSGGVSGGNRTNPVNNGGAANGTINVPVVGAGESAHVGTIISVPVANGVVESEPTTNIPHKNNNTAMIAGLTVAGLVASGALVGGIVAANSNKSNEVVVAQETFDPDLEAVMQKANGALGTVGGKSVSLISMPTTTNSFAKFVDINGNVVAVVGYAGHNLPYSIKNGKWIPLLGIGEKGHWFNVYPDSGASVKAINAITNLLNQQINPNVLTKYVGLNNSGVSLPKAAQDAYKVINAEFPNGVVQNEQMSAADAKLYNDNFNIIVRALN